MTACNNLNTYPDKGPFQETSVILDCEANKGLKRAEKIYNLHGDPDKYVDSYINACHIKSAFREAGEPDGHIIATQEPEEHTEDAFWRMVMKYKVGKIVTYGHERGGKSYTDGGYFG